MTPLFEGRPPGPLALSILAGAFAIDLTVGEWPTAWHPVVWMGRLQRLLRRGAPTSPAAAFAYGSFMAVSGPVLFGFGSAFLLNRLHGWRIAWWLTSVCLLKSSFAIRALGDAARRVAAALGSGDLAQARVALRSLVSRPTEGLPSPLLAAAAVESVAENTSDSVIAPLFYFALAGVPGALAYRAANTLDSLIGYHGETEWLGKAAARLDDLLNWLPSRISAALLVLAAPFGGGSALNAFRIWRRDSGATESPNAGQPMAAMAGALGVELEKVGHYRLGAPQPSPGPATIQRAVTLMGVSCVLGALIATALGWLHGRR